MTNRECGKSVQAQKTGDLDLSHNCRGGKIEEEIADDYCFSCKNSFSLLLSKSEIKRADYLRTILQFAESLLSKILYIGHPECTVLKS